MTLYPKIRNIKKDNIALKIMIIISLLVSLLVFIINIITSKEHFWSLIVIMGILYAWITVMYSVYRNVNIGSSITVQFIAISILTLCIDFILGYRGWAINIAIPIIIITANVTMLILTIVVLQRYYKYAINQLIIFILSMIPLLILFLSKQIITNKILVIISSSIALFTFIISLILCGKNIIQELDRRLHM